MYRTATIAVQPNTLVILYFGKFFFGLNLAYVRGIQNSMSLLWVLPHWLSRASPYGFAMVITTLTCTFYIL